jgi:beta-glucosidase
MTFRPDFTWGAATAAAQIEGAAEADGKGLSTWDVFARLPGRTLNGDTPEIACDHYHRMRDDVALMKELGLKAYRFGISWPRVMPEGTGRVNAAGLDFYDRLVDELLRAGIEPWPTLFHWDLPQALQERWNGWQSVETAKALGEYARVVGERLTDRVANWFTINEIKCFTDLAHISKRFAPGTGGGWPAANQATHHALVGHGLCLRALRAVAKRPIRAGLVEDAWTTIPLWDAPEHIEAALKAFKTVNQRVLFPALTGRYDETLYRRFGGDHLPVHTAEEMDLIGTPMDFIGYNNYSGSIVRAADNADGYEMVSQAYAPDAPNNRTILPRGIEWLLRASQHHAPHLPSIIAENGLGNVGELETVAGEVLDLDRIEYLRAHIRGVQRAIHAGADCRGYFVWSLFDNFEWASGYGTRFGLIRVTFPTLRRTIKASGRWYAEVMRRNALL